MSAQPQPQPLPGTPGGPRPLGTGPEGPKSTQTLFVRNATGLVRDLTAWDAFNLVFAAVLVPIGFMEVMSFAPQFWPHADLLLSFLIAAPLVACFGAVYLYFTELMPRSGGDYVWLSRTLHPFAGFVVNVGLTYVFLTWVALNFALLVTVLMPSLAFVAGIKAGWVASPGHLEQVLIATVLTVLYALLMIRGIRPVARFMTVSFVVVWIGVIALAIIMGVGSHAGFIHNWNTSNPAGLSYTGVISRAGGLGFSVIGPISWAATLYAMVYAFNVYTGFQWTGCFAGEIKNVRRSAVTSIVGGLIAAVIGYVVLAAVVYKFFGYKFFGSLVYLGFGPGSSHVNLGFSPYIPSLVKFFPVAQAVQVGIVICFILTIIWWTPAGFLLGTRNAFAWSFDRLAPERLTSVSDRYHTPVVATIFIAVVIEILNLLNVYSNLAAWLLSVIWILGAGFVVVSIAAGLLPWLHRDLFDRGPGWGKARFLALPVITWVAIVSAVSWGFVVWAAFKTGFAGSLAFRPMIESAVVPIVAALWYVGIWYYRRRQGVNLGRLFHEIPPSEVTSTAVNFDEQRRRDPLPAAAGETAGMSAVPTREPAGDGRDHLPEVGRRLVRAAADRGFTIRLIGGAAIWLRSTDAARRALERDYLDLDLVAHKAESRQLRTFLEEVGYAPDRLFNAMHGETRLLFHHALEGYQIDVFLDEFRMSHNLDLGARLGLEGPTLQAAELLLTKLQIAEVNVKDVGDVVMLLWSHVPGCDDGPGRLNVEQVAKVCGASWGLFTTVADNLRQTGDLLDNVLRSRHDLAGPAPARESASVAVPQGGVPVPEGDDPVAADVRAKLAVVLDRMERHPKTLGWRARAKVGRRVRWYEVPEEVTR